MADAFKALADEEYAVDSVWLRGIKGSSSEMCLPDKHVHRH